ncbi:MAG: SRPBCC family protein [Streptosporangiaceae bacterium]|jgi:hypothetical protein
MDLPELRFSDCPTAESSLLIAAPPRAVWDLVCDIQLPARFSSEFQGADWLDGATGPALGARFTGRNTHPAIGSWQTTATICEFDPERTLAWSIGDPASPAARWRFALAPAGGRTMLTMWMQIGPGRSGISAAIDAMPDKESRILHRRLAEHRANMAATLAGLKELAEAARAPEPA